MLARSLLDLHTTLHDQNVVFVFHGYLTDPLLTALGAVVRQRLQFEGIDGRRGRDIFAVYVEQGQNIIRYSAERCIVDDVEQAYGIIAIGREDGRYAVASANPVQNDQVAHLRKQFQVLETLDGDGLKALHKKRLREPPPPNSKGAGVGFIEMARRGSDGLHVDFTQNAAGTALFVIKVAL